MKKENKKKETKKEIKDIKREEKKEEIKKTVSVKQENKVKAISFSAPSCVNWSALK